MACKGDPIECGWEAALGNAEQAIEAFLILWDEAQPALNAVVGSALIHGVEYTGPPLGLVVARLRTITTSGRGGPDGD